MLSVDSCCVGSSLAVPLSVLLGVSAADNKDIMMYIIYYISIFFLI